MISKYRPRAVIFALTADARVARQLALRWGVEAAVAARRWDSAEEMAALAATAAREKGIVRDGDLTVITSGIKSVTGNTNAIRVYRIG